jgi:tRNA pseudouridine13 synthase
VALEPEEHGYRASFELPKGTYATVVLAELTKTEPGDLPDAADDA